MHISIATDTAILVACLVLHVVLQYFGAELLQYLVAIFLV